MMSMSITGIDSTALTHRPRVRQCCMLSFTVAANEPEPPGPAAGQSAALTQLLRMGYPPEKAGEPRPTAAVPIENATAAVSEHVFGQLSSSRWRRGTWPRR